MPPYDFLFDFSRNYVSIFYRFRDIVIPVEFRGDLWLQKTRLHGVSCGVVCVILCLAVLVDLRLVSDRHRQTDTGPMVSTADA